ncbi:hypothetical protein [Cytobacillus praedii]|uniref:hypothetical protein n=1 Tax=Cytobacillus praedii TaxID=1742358 RepID=UPI002E2319CD|nr:hypothetical protein [Cytobacillus praedii]
MITKNLLNKHKVVFAYLNEKGMNMSFKNADYYLNLDQALKKFEEKIEEYRKREYLASKEDAIEHNISNEPAPINDSSPEDIKRAMVC